MSGIFLMASGGPEFTPLLITPFGMSDLNLLSLLILALGSSTACSIHHPHLAISFLRQLIPITLVFCKDLVNLGVFLAFPFSVPF